MHQHNPIPLALYIHIPWCLKKCPYCDFYSCAIKLNREVEGKYLDALMADLVAQRNNIQQRSLSSIYIGGGTPSLLSVKSLDNLFNAIHKNYTLSKDCEISLEANPGTINLSKCRGLKSIGINRLSIGIQSFQDDKLKVLGRIHDAKQAQNTVENAHQAGFNNINLDLMYGLPKQSVDDAIYDLTQANQLEPTHLSWYQLTIEKGTAFGKKPPALPDEKILATIEKTGKKLLCEFGFKQYEISAYAKPGFKCRHNLNYWQFGDYLGIGAGAHGKLTIVKSHPYSVTVKRYANTTNYKHYIKADRKIIKTGELPLEFMLNALRLNSTTSVKLFEQRTGLKLTSILPNLNQAFQAKLLTYNTKQFGTTALGRKFLNDLLALF